jgi:hypothetical protein
LDATKRSIPFYALPFAGGAAKKLSDARNQLIEVERARSRGDTETAQQLSATVPMHIARAVQGAQMATRNTQIGIGIGAVVVSVGALWMWKRRR